MNYQRNFVGFLRRCLDSEVFVCEVCRAMLRCYDATKDDDQQQQFVVEMLGTYTGQQIDKLHTALFPFDE